MNYRDENSPDQRPELPDDIPEDRQLKNLLDEWRAPEITGSFNQRMLSAYRRQVEHQPWWRRWLTGSIRLPLPVAATAVLLLCGISYLAMRKATSYPIEVPPASTSVKILKVPFPVIQEKVVTRIVYAKAGPQKAGENSPPDSLNAPGESKSSARADLAGFGPVSEIRIFVSQGGEEK